MKVWADDAALTRVLETIVWNEDIPTETPNMAYQTLLDNGYVDAEIKQAFTATGSRLFSTVVRYLMATFGDRAVIKGEAGTE